MNGLTPDQDRAVAARGDVLVMAGAGTGKTGTLVERCVSLLTVADEPLSLDRMLMVTFTEAAAAEMRRRIRSRLETLLGERPDALWLAEQLALVDTARISTLHGFCLHLVRDHFHELAIDPELNVLPEEATVLLARETLDRLLTRCYRGEWGQASALQDLVWEHGRSWDGPVRDLVLRLHHYTQTLRHPDGWFARELERLAQSAPAHWDPWLRAGLKAWRDDWLPVLDEQPVENTVAQRCSAALRSLDDQCDCITLAAILSAIASAAEGPWPRGQKVRLRKPLERFFADARFLKTLMPGPDGTDPLLEDWQWVRQPLTALLELARQFGKEFTAAKRDLGAVDFHDLEQFALRLLWDPERDHPSTIAQSWRARFEYLFVDEYQDINEAQDIILRALGRDGSEANRFLVGDIKQSIYRFRLANPRIFQHYARTWKQGDPHRQVLHLVDNFRSHEGILEFVNRCFSALMREELGGVTCDTAEQLRFGSPESRVPLRLAADVPPPVELQLLLHRASPGDDVNSSADESADELSDTEWEARAIGIRLRALKTEEFLVWDAASGARRPVEWRDMAVLLRSPSGKVEAYAKVFELLGLPLVAGRGGFYESSEICDLISLLEVLDNPLQDLPLLALLYSPIVGLSAEELAHIRVASRSGYVWTALRRFHRASAEYAGPRSEAPPGPRQSGWSKVDRFLDCMRRWRRCARQESLSACLESILDETAYEAWLSQTARGNQRLANVRRLLGLTRQFDQFERQGLFRFLRFITAQREAGLDAEPASPPPSECIRLLSVHQSKGLEFPVVVVADLGKRFNLTDLSSRVILDETFGLCPQIQPPHTAQRYPSLPYWLAQRRQRQETFGEELRLFYVATTRACDLLILSGISRESSVAERWKLGLINPVPLPRLLSAQSCLDWLGAWIPSATGHTDWTQGGQCSWLRWSVVLMDSAAPLENSVATSPQIITTAGTPATEAGPSSEWVQRLEWRYDYPFATRTAAKASVSHLRRRAMAMEEDAWPLIPMIQESISTLTGADLGTAHHRFLELVAFHCIHEPDLLRAEAERMCQEQLLTGAEREALDFDAMAAFWRSEVGARIRRHSSQVQRELPFTARFDLAELEALGFLGAGELDLHEASGADWMIVQGVVDLAVVLPTELWILDFKTDRVTPSTLNRKVEAYRPQLQLYSHALARIYRRPVRDCWLHFFAVRQTVRVEAKK